MTCTHTRPVVLWFRQDLRLRDQPGLAAALATGAPVAAVYILDDAAPGRWAMGGASRWWLHHSLAALAASLRPLNIDLQLLHGPAHAVLLSLADEIGAGAVFWTRQYEPYAIARDRRIKAALGAKGVDAESFNGQLLYEPWDIGKADGRPYEVFTAFWRALHAKGAPPAPTPAPPPAPSAIACRAALPLEALGLVPRKPDWAGGLRDTWTPGEAGAHRALGDFLDHHLAHYHEARDLPARAATSRLSPHLHFGELSPRVLWHAVSARCEADPCLTKAAEKFLSELAWREFAHHLLYAHPDMPDAPLRTPFADFPWRDDEAAFSAWTRGATGYPIVDAGMRELWQTGTMHNRVRMIAASFLVKDLLIPWQRGAAWFWDTLVDADLANNSMGWQWVTGCGADAAPYFRIFNPVLQGERFDPEGEYVRRFVPELAKLPGAWIHKPFAAHAETLARANITLGKTYPQPIVNHAKARARALDAFAQIKGAGD